MKNQFQSKKANLYKYLEFHEVDAHGAGELLESRPEPLPNEGLAVLVSPVNEENNKEEKIRENEDWPKENNQNTSGSERS